MWDQMSPEHSLSLSHIPTRDSGHHTVSRSTQYEDASARTTSDTSRKGLNIAETVRIIKMFNPTNTNTQGQQTEMHNKMYHTQSMPSSLGVDSSLHPLATKLRERKRDMAEKSLTSKSQPKALVVVNRTKHVPPDHGDYHESQLRSPRKDHFDRSIVYASEKKRSSESRRSSSLVGNECSMVDKQRAELQLLIVELKERDRELNEMVASHQHQLESWEQDRERVHSLETQCARMEGEQNMRSNQIRTLVKRVRLLESNDQSHLTALESSQQQLFHITEQHSKATQRIQELQEKKESLNQTLMQVAVRTGQLEAREQELATLLKLKDADLCACTERIQELTQQVKQLQQTCLQLQEEEARLQKLVVDWERKHNSNLEQLAKMKADLDLSQQWEHGSQRALDKHRSEVLALQKQLRLAAERERRKDELIESQRLRQERTDLELANMRKLYERQVHDMSSLQLNLKQTKQQMDWGSPGPSKEEDEELSELSTSYQSFTNPGNSKPSSPQPMSAASRQLSQSAPDCHQVSPKDSPRLGLSTMKQYTFPERPAYVDPADRPDMKKWAFSNILHSEDFRPMRRHGSESDVQDMVAKSANEPSSLNQSYDGIAARSPTLNSRSERHLSNLEMLDKFRLTALSSDLDKAGISDAVNQRAMSSVALTSSEEETETRPTCEGERRENAQTQTPRELERIVSPDLFTESVSRETKQPLIPALKPYVQKCVADKDEEKDTEDPGNRSALADSSYEVIDSDSIANIRLITDSQEIAARISDLLTNDISQSEGSTAFSSQSGHDRDTNDHSEVTQAISQSVSHLLAPTPPQNMDPDSNKSSINAWVRQANRNQSNMMREYDFIDSLENIPCEPVMIDLNDSTDTNGSTLEASALGDETFPESSEANIVKPNENNLGQTPQFTTSHPGYRMNSSLLQNEIRDTYSFDLNFPNYRAIPRSPPEHPHVVFDDSMSAVSGLTEDETPVKEEPMLQQPAPKPMINSPTSELERILAESDAMVATFEQCLNHEDGFNQSKGSKASWPVSSARTESEDSNSLLSRSMGDFIED